MTKNQAAADVFKKLLNISDRLLGPNGCPWDLEQTPLTLRESILEEVYEIIEAIDLENDTHLIEELGDLLYNIVFLAKLAEKEGRFTIADPIQEIHNKLISRHPHVFGEVKLTDSTAVRNQWEELKKQEKKERTSALDGIPPHLPALARAYKVAGKLKEPSEEPFQDEQEVADALWDLVKRARSAKINPEIALRKLLMHKEADFRRHESNS